MFYAACNCVFTHSSYVGQTTQLSVPESYCCPILSFAFAVFSLKSSQLSERLLEVGFQDNLILLDGSQLGCLFMDWGVYSSS